MGRAGNVDTTERTKSFSYVYPTEYINVFRCQSGGWALTAESRSVRLATTLKKVGNAEAGSFTAR
ncbi:hypothetical protein D3D02_11205 [Halobellus sp. Atlit-38R]|jgi:hypothetical protein|nr:hypothetical protein D3D02_11205 [Halobellus sp. Atlit-38R]